jgi:hypothetical protein
MPIIALLLAFHTVLDEQCSIFVSEGNNLFIAPSADRFLAPFSVCPLTTGVCLPGGKVGRNVKLIVDSSFPASPWVWNSSCTSLCFKG